MTLELLLNFLASSLELLLCAFVHCIWYSLKTSHCFGHIFGIIGILSSLNAILAQTQNQGDSAGGIFALVEDMGPCYKTMY